MVRALARGVLALSVAVSGCRAGPEITRLQARPAAPSVALQPGEHELGLSLRRDGILYIPKRAAAGTPVPLLVLMHGGSQRATLFRFTFPLAEELGVVILTLDARDNTWDGIDSPFGPDVRFIDAAMRHTFQSVAIDPHRIALGGFSDGASYALSLGLMNGDLFTHLVAFSPGFLTQPGPPAGRPLIFMAHGVRDHVIGIETSRRMVPRLKSLGYDVTYREFNGPHMTPGPIARAALEWLAR